MQKNIQGERVKELRKSLGMSQEQLARKVGVTYQIISKIETGRIMAPSGKTVYNLAQALKTTIDYLMGGIGFSQASDNIEKKIPVLSLREANEWCRTDIKDLKEGNRVFIKNPIETDEKGVFALKITTDAMEGYGGNQIPKGSIAICVPIKEIKANRFVVFFNENKNSSLLREAIIEDDIYLKPVNSQYMIEKNSDSLKPIAEVVGFVNIFNLL